MPVYEYGHGSGNCSVSGGTVAHGTAVPSLEGWYVFGDWCSGRLWALRLGAGGPEIVELVRTGRISSIVAGADSQLYVLDHGAGALLRIDPA